MHAVAANATGATPSLPNPTSTSTAVDAAPRLAHSRNFVVASLSIFISSADADARATTTRAGPTSRRRREGGARAEATFARETARADMTARERRAKACVSRMSRERAVRRETRAWLGLR